MPSTVSKAKKKIVQFVWHVLSKSVVEVWSPQNFSVSSNLSFLADCSNFSPASFSAPRIPVYVSFLLYACINTRPCAVTPLVSFTRRAWFHGKNTLAPLKLRKTGCVLCRIVLWDCYEDTNASFGGCYVYEAAQKAKSNFSPSNSLIGPY